MLQKTRIRWVLLVAGASLVAPLVVPAQEGGKPPAMSPEEQAMMQKWQAFMTPGEPHKRLATHEGSWTNKVTMWSAPGAPPATSDGTSEIKMILDGRYLQETSQGSFQGMPFQGSGLTGYDNIKKKYVSTWIDNFGTGIMVAEGTYDPATKTLTSMGESPDVMTGKYKPMKIVEKGMGPDGWSSEMFNRTPDGKGWWKTMEIVYTRKP